VYIGYLSKGSASYVINENVFGYNAVGIGNNTVVLGDMNITKTSLNGLVGIGTTAPTAKLEVVTAGTSGTSALRIGDTSTGTTLIILDKAQTASKALCINATGCLKVCSSVVDAAGGCTCN
jgi:hypothetical protein